MIFDRTLGRAVVAKNNSPCVFELWRHLLGLDRHVEVSKLKFHIGHALVANWTSVGSLHILIQTGTMYAMPALHETDSFRGCEHIIAAYRAITVRDSLYAPMVRLLGDGDTSTAFLLLTSSA